MTIKENRNAIVVIVFILLVGAFLGLLANWGIEAYRDAETKECAERIAHETTINQTNIDNGATAMLAAITLSVLQNGQATIQPRFPEYNHTIACVAIN